MNFFLASSPLLVFLGVLAVASSPTSLFAP